MDELAGRTLGRLRSLLSEAPFDRLLCGLPENISYVTGYRSVAAELIRSHQMAALVGESELHLIGPRADAAAALEVAVDPDQYLAFGRFYFESAEAGAIQQVEQYESFADAVEGAVRRLARPGVIGIDAGLPGALRARVGSLPGVKAVVPADDWLYEVRSVKLPEEIARLATAARLAEDGITTALEAAEPGTTERDMAERVAATIVRGGAAPRFAVVTAGQRSALSDARPTDKAWQPGELVRFDVGCVYEGYWSDVGRTAVLGAPNAEQARRYGAILAGEEAQLAMVGPDIRADELFTVAIEVVESAGLRPYRRHHCGHAIGSEVYERPIVAPGWETELRENMVLALEIPYYELGWGGMMIEDIVVVTAEGHRRLTHSDRSLRIVEA